jgi:uncharacterized protein (TIGR03790 family)
MKKSGDRRQKTEVGICRNRLSFCLLASVFCLLAFSSPGLEPDQLLLITNKNAPQGLKLAEFYAENRAVPAGRILELDLPTSEELPADAYDRNVVPAVRAFLREHALERKVTCLVTFFGLPIRVAGRINLLQDQQELAAITAQKALLPAKTEPFVIALEKLADEVSPPDAATRPTAGNGNGNGGELELLARRAESALRRIDRRASSLPPPQRQELQHRAIESLSPLLGPMGMLQRQVLEYGASTTEPATRPAASTQALERLTAFRRELAQLQERKYDSESRQRLRDLVAANFGPFEYGRVLSNHIAYFQTDNTVAAFDSELALLWWEYPKTGWQVNPLYYATPSLKGPPTMMVMRLDGPDAGTVSQMITASLKAEAEGLKGRVVIDSRGLHADAKGKFDPYSAYDQSLRNLADIIRTKAKLPLLLDERPDVLAPGTAKDVALYMGWYSVDKYVPACQFVPGAVGFHLASFTMITLKREDPRGWVRGLLTDGIAATLGPVAEPYLQAFPTADDFFPLLLTGKLTLAEVYWKTTPWTSWMISMIGDPLYTPYKTNPALTIEDLPPRLQGIFHSP